LGDVGPFLAGHSAVLFLRLRGLCLAFYFGGLLSDFFLGDIFIIFLIAFRFAPDEYQKIPK
jgi:hypothetical protein